MWVIHDALGPSMNSLLAATVCAVAFLLVAVRLRRRGFGWASVLATVSLGFLCTMMSVGVRPQVLELVYLALLLLAITTNLSSMGIVREREVGTLEQLNVTPLRRWELIVGKLLPYGLVGMIDVCLVLAVTVFWFQVPLRGSLSLLLALTGVYLLTTLGLGLFVSTISSTQQQAMMTTMFFFLLPMVFLSGFIFPIENMPEAIQVITYAFPLRYFLVILRSIFLKGVGLETFWPQAVALTAWGVGVLSLAIARSSKRTA